MGRNILFITTDQQRYDSLGCNGGTIARTPVVDRLAADGINFQQARPPNVVCMNGVPLPADAPSVAGWLHDQAGYRTALFGKAHFEPFLDPGLGYYENR